MKLSEVRSKLKDRGVRLPAGEHGLAKLLHSIDPVEVGPGNHRDYDHCQVEALWGYLEHQRLMGVQVGRGHQDQSSGARQVFDLVSHAPCTPSYVVKCSDGPWSIILDPAQSVEAIMGGQGVTIIPIHFFCERKYGERYPGKDTD